MKNSNCRSRLTFSVLLTVLLTAGLAAADIVTYTATLSGANEVPPNASTAVGTAILTVDTDGSSQNLPLSVVFSGLSSTQTGAHVHIAAAGGNGPITNSLPLGSPLDTTMNLNNLTEIAALVSQELYVNIHTENFPGGEIRGQLIQSGTVATDNPTWGAIKSLYR